VLHRRVAEILRDRFPDTAAAEPEVVAHHFTQAALTDACHRMVGQGRRPGAAPFSLSGGDLASQQGHRDGRQNRRRYICRRDCIRFGQPTPQNTNRSWQGDHVVSGVRRPGIEAAFISARELAAAIDNATERFTVYSGLWQGNIARGELEFALEIAETFLREAERGARTTECGFGRRLLGFARLSRGDFVEAQSNLVEALSIYDSERDREARFRFGQDTGATASTSR
jgi:hypothetical protein